MGGKKSLHKLHYSTSELHWNYYFFLISPQTGERCWGYNEDAYYSNKKHAADQDGKGGTNG